MRKILGAVFNFIAKSMAVIFAILFVIISVLVLLLTSFDHTLLHAGAYKRALVMNRVYEQLPFLFAEQFSQMKDFLADPCAGNLLGCYIDGASPELKACLVDTLGGEDVYEKIGTGQRSPTEAELKASQPCIDEYGDPASLPGPVGGSPDESGPSTDQGASGSQMAYLNNLSSDQWQALILHLLPPRELQEMTETTLDQLFAYLNGETDTAKMPLVKLKARLTGQAGQDLLLLLIDAQPPCTEEQQAQINSGNFGGDGRPPVVCAARGETLDKLLRELQSQMNEAASKIPDEAPLVKPPSASDPSSGGGPLGKDPHAALQKINTAVRLSPLLPLALLFLMTLFGARSMKGWLRWSGIPLFIAGLIPLSFGIAALPAFENAWIRYIVPKFPPMFSTSSLIKLGHDLAHSVVRDLAIWVMLEAGLIALLGLGAIVGSYYVKPRSEQSTHSVTLPESLGNDVA